MSVYKKWLPIMDHVIPDKSDIVKNKMSEYVEHHSMMYPNIISTNNQFGAGMQTQLGDTENTLPHSLFIASKLVELDPIIEKGNLIISDKPVQQHIYKGKLSFDIHDLGNHAKETIEQMMIEEIVRDLKIKLKHATQFIVYSLCSRIYVEEGYAYLISDYKIVGSREEKLKRILKNEKC